jgi:hypothetical protein
VSRLTAKAPPGGRAGHRTWAGREVLRRWEPRGEIFPPAAPGEALNGRPGTGVRFPPPPREPHESPARQAYPAFRWAAGVQSLISLSEEQPLRRRRPVAWIEHRENGWLSGGAIAARAGRRSSATRMTPSDSSRRSRKSDCPGTDVRVDEQGYFWAPTRRHEPEDPAYTVEEYAKAMVEANQDLADTTRALYRRIIRVWIEGTDVGRADVRYITPEVIERWWASLPTDKPGALGNVALMLSASFRRAVKRGLRGSNPLGRTDVRKPRRSGPEERPLTTSEVAALVDAAVPARDRLEILVMAYGGLRAGEVGGLRVADIDFGQSQVHISRQRAIALARCQAYDTLWIRDRTLPMSPTSSSSKSRRKAVLPLSWLP